MCISVVKGAADWPISHENHCRHFVSHKELSLLTLWTAGVTNANAG